MSEKNEQSANWLAASMHPLIGCGHAHMVVESWAGKTPDQIAAELHCHPQTVTIVQGVGTADEYMEAIAMRLSQAHESTP